MKNSETNAPSQELTQLMTQFWETLKAFVVSYGMRVVGALVLIIVGYTVAKIIRNIGGLDLSQRSNVLLIHRKIN